MRYMIDLSITSLIINVLFFFIWLIDSSLNSLLAKRLWGTKGYSYMIPFYSYYRFGVQTGNHPIMILIGMVATIITTKWFDLSLSPQYIILITLVSAAINAAIISRAAFSFAKSKWRYAIGSVICGLISICLYLPMLLLAQHTVVRDLWIFLLFIPPLCLQLPKIILCITSSKENMTVDGGCVSERK